MADIEGANESGILIPAGATAGGTFTIANRRSRSVVFVISTTTASGGNTVQVTVNGLTQQLYAYPILVGSTVATVAVTPLRIGPGLTPSSNAVSNDVAPRTMQLVVTVVGTVAYGIDYVLGA